MLFRVEPNDPATFVAVTTLILAVALAACFLPAYRASRLNPLAELRDE